MFTDTQRKELKKLYDKRGYVTASAFVASAEDKKSSLHDLFEWDDSKAAHQHRLWQARYHLRKFTIEIEDKAERLVHVPTLTKQGGEGRYIAISTVQANFDDYNLARRELLSKVNGLYSSLKALETGAKNKGLPTDAFVIAAEALATARSAVEVLPH